MSSLMPPLCLACRHLQIKPGLPCAAFPEGIPDAIFESSFIHIEAYPGDNGLLFEAKRDLSDKEQELVRDGKRLNREQKHAK